MSIKAHLIRDHLDLFPENCPEVIEEMGERMHQEMAIIEARYDGFLAVQMMADYCWLLERDFFTAMHKGKSIAVGFLPRL